MKASIEIGFRLVKTSEMDTSNDVSAQTPTQSHKPQAQNTHVDQQAGGPPKTRNTMRSSHKQTIYPLATKLSANFSKGSACTHSRIYRIVFTYTAVYTAHLDLQLHHVAASRRPHQALFIRHR